MLYVPSLRLSHLLLPFLINGLCQRHPFGKIRCYNMGRGYASQLIPNHINILNYTRAGGSKHFITTDFNPWIKQQKNKRSA